YVFETTNNKRLLKVAQGNARTEFNALKNLQKTFIVPRVNKNKFKFLPLQSALFPKHSNQGYSMFLMGKVGKGMTLLNYIRHYNHNKENIQRRVKYLVNQLQLHGWSHGNLHEKNIIVEVTPSGRLSGMWVVDFGRATKIPIGKTEFQALGRGNGMYHTWTALTGPNYARNLTLYGGKRSNLNMAGMYGIIPNYGAHRRRAEVAKELANARTPRRVSTVRRTKSFSFKRSANTRTPRRVSAIRRTKSFSL
ncbi:hypothetical protein EBT25_12510, partial [bacterium]|nr:hypothetical protein [bacterium]